MYTTETLIKSSLFSSPHSPATHTYRGHHTGTHTYFFFLVRKSFSDADACITYVVTQKGTSSTIYQIFTSA